MSCNVYAVNQFQRVPVYSLCVFLVPRKLCQYFGEEKDGDSLQEDWEKASPNDKETKDGCSKHETKRGSLSGVGWLLETGFDDARLESVSESRPPSRTTRRPTSWR